MKTEWLLIGKEDGLVSNVKRMSEGRMLQATNVHARMSSTIFI